MPRRPPTGPGAGRRARLAVFGGLTAVNVATAGARTPAALIAYRVSKTALMPSLAWATRPRDPRVRTALAASAVGDAAMMVHTNAGLVAGIAAFATAHGGYLARLLDPGPPRVAHPTPARRRTARDAALAMGWLGVTALAAAQVHRHAGPDERAVVGPAMAYGALVTGMGAAAVRTGIVDGRPRLVVGGIAFVVSDALVAVWTFGRPLPAGGTVEQDVTATPPEPWRWLDPLIMATYCLAQYCLVTGLEPDRSEGAR